MVFIVTSCLPQQTRGILEIIVSATQAECYSGSTLPTGRVRPRHHLGTLEVVTGRTYADNRPYLLPETLDELRGPVTGAILLPLHLDWSERIALHLDDPAERKLMYQRVIREASRTDDLRRYLNAEVLRDIWPALYLPVQVRRLWEDRFPDLTLAA